MLDRRKLAAIHIAKKSAGVLDDEYRFILSQYGVKSSRDLSDQEAADLIRDLNDRRQIIGGPAVGKLWAIWYNDVKPFLPEPQQTAAYLVGIVKKVSGAKISRAAEFKYLTNQELYKSIEALKRKADELSPVPF